MWDYASGATKGITYGTETHSEVDVRTLIFSTGDNFAIYTYCLNYKARLSSTANSSCQLSTSPSGPIYRHTSNLWFRSFLP